MNKQKSKTALYFLTTTTLIFTLLFYILALGYEYPYSDVKVLRANPRTSENASITKYRWTGNKMANGEYPHIGAVAVSDRTISFGTKIIIDNEEYVVKDRTALWVYEKFGLVIDIYSEESLKDILEFGRQNKVIKILTI